MTTTPEPTPEQAITEAMNAVDEMLAASQPAPYCGNDAYAKLIAQALRAHGLLVGDPTKKQIEAARVAVHRVFECEWAVIASALKMDQGQYDTLLSDIVAAVVAATGVAPQEPNERPCTCPSGDGSLRWPCPSHPPHCSQCGDAMPKLASPQAGTVGPFWEERFGIPAGSIVCPECYVRMRDAWHRTQSPDREKLIAEARECTWVARELKHGAPSHADMIDALADALAAAPVLDEEKLAEALRGHTVRRGTFECKCGWFPTIGDDDLGRHQARVVAEALRGGGR